MPRPPGNMNTIQMNAASWKGVHAGGTHKSDTPHSYTHTGGCRCVLAMVHTCLAWTPLLGAKVVLMLA